MKKLFIAGLLTLSLGAMAEEAADTTVVYNGKQFVISEDSVETRVSIYAQDGQELRKSKESTFVGSQEVERFYVSSPFFNIGSPRYQSTTPHLYAGFVGMSSSALGFGGNSDMPVKAFRSYEVGMPWMWGGWWINRRYTWSLSLSMDFLLNRYTFDGHHVLMKDAEGRSFTQYDANGVGQSYLMTITDRLKLMAKWYKYFENPEDDRLCIGAGLTLDLSTYNYSSFKQNGYVYAGGAGLEINPVRLGLNLQVSWGGSIFYLQKSLTPMFKSGYGPKTYPFSIGIGFAL